MRSAVEAILGHIPEGLPDRVAGGCIHECSRWGDYFIKSNSAARIDVFHAEAEGLRTIAETGTIRTPAVVAIGTHGNLALLILEYLDLRGTGDEGALGESLAAMHRHSSSNYGFASDNFIGNTPQTNTPHPHWPGFFADQRLGAMFDRLALAGVHLAGSQQLMLRLETLLPKTPPASLLHGDLWGGNKAFLADGSPVIFDPACYYGHAACDLAMTGLFGGFGEEFYQAYHGSTDEGMEEPGLHELYNLYHLLNHALLFGGGYISQAQQIIRRYC